MYWIIALVVISTPLTIFAFLCYVRCTPENYPFEIGD